MRKSWSPTVNTTLCLTLIIVSMITFIGITSLQICFGDTIYLTNTEMPIHLKIKKVTEKYLIGTIQKPLVVKVNLEPGSNHEFPDSISFRDDTQTKMRCKIMGITDNVYAVKVPMKNIKSLEMNGKGKSVNNKSRTTTSKKKKDLLDIELLEDLESESDGISNYESGANNSSSSNYSSRNNSYSNKYSRNKKFDTTPSEKINPDEFKEQIKREILESMARENDIKPKNSEEIDPAKLKEDVKREIIDAMAREKQVEEETYLRNNTGNIEGRILRKGEPLPDCEVQIVALSQERILLMKSVKKGDQFKEKTDENGEYFFKAVPPGQYKLYWKPSYATSWIRKFKMIPDVKVVARRTTIAKDLEIGKRVMNQE